MKTKSLLFVGLLTASMLSYSQTTRKPCTDSKERCELNATVTAMKKELRDKEKAAATQRCNADPKECAAKKAAIKAKQMEVKELRKGL